MGRQRLERVRDLDKAKARAASINSIDPALDLGKGLTLAAYNGEIKKLTDSIAAYNDMLGQVDGLYNIFEKQKDRVNDLSERMLAGVGSTFGKDSDEYEKAGGTRKSEKKKPVRKPKTP